MDPEFLEVLRSLHGLWHGKQHPLDDPGEVPQVEQVVTLGGGRQQVDHGTRVHRQGPRHHLFSRVLEVIREGAGNENLFQNQLKNKFPFFQFLKSGPVLRNEQITLLSMFLNSGPVLRNEQIAILSIF